MSKKSAITIRGTSEAHDPEIKLPHINGLCRLRPVKVSGLALECCLSRTHLPNIAEQDRKSLAEKNLILLFQAHIRCQCIYVPNQADVDYWGLIAMYRALHLDLDLPHRRLDAPEITDTSTLLCALVDDYMRFIRTRQPQLVRPGPTHLQVTAIKSWMMRLLRPLRPEKKELLFKVALPDHRNPETSLATIKPGEGVETPFSSEKRKGSPEESFDSGAKNTRMENEDEQSMQDRQERLMSRRMKSPRSRPLTRQPTQSMMSDDGQDVMEGVEQALKEGVLSVYFAF